jgi:CheY-like chemotaxis protein
LTENPSTPRKPARGDTAQAALAAANQALAAANAAVAAAVHALELSTEEAKRKPARRRPSSERKRAPAPRSPEPRAARPRTMEFDPQPGPRPPLPVELEARGHPDGAAPIRLGPSTEAPAPPEPPPPVEPVPPAGPPPAPPPARDEAETARLEVELVTREADIAQREAAMARYSSLEPARRVPAVPQAESNGYTVLVVDDEEQVRALTVRILSRYGYNVLEAPGVEVALAVLDSGDTGVDLVLSDVAMPGLSGKDLFRRISETRPGLPVVFMSGYALGVYAPEGLIEEGVKMLPKPFTQDDLLAFVTGALTGVNT